MKIAKVTSGGQLSIPASVRKRWGTRRVALDDQGDRLVVTPLPEDPIAAARGALQGRLASSSDLREAARRNGDDAASRRRSSGKRP
jgi:bifunctional DNA-binding transcriptional regulator/antitoxin component of YhaV-PrlF toxin-antitoxin module